MSSNQTGLFDRPTRTFGPAYDPQKDGPRLRRQHEVIRDLMLDGLWRSLPEIALATGYPEASISAQLRHLRKERFGSYEMTKRRRSDGGLYEYHVEPPKQGHLIEIRPGGSRR